MKVDISTDGIEKALLKGKEDYDQRQFNLEVSVFTHIIAGILSGPHEEIPMGQVSKKWLFEVVNTKVYQTLFKKSIKRCATDEVPSEYMVNLYKEFKEWQAKGMTLREIAAELKNYGCITTAQNISLFLRKKK